jgi:hypothetical protein
MVAYIFQRLLEEGGPSGKNVLDARDWFRGTAVRARPQQILRGSDPEQHALPRFKRVLRQGRFEWGRMLTFQYDPKTKDKLPYYDKFPLIFIIDVERDSFLGLNMHYLPPILRARMMDGLWDYVPLQEGEKLKETDKLQMMRPYQILQRIRKLRWYKPCIKRYLNNHVQSRFVTVYPEEWNLALFLPMATRTFIGASQNQVWRESRQIVRGQK